MIEALTSLVGSLGIDVFDTDATEATRPYYLLILAPEAGRHDNEPISTRGQGDRVIVRAVGVEPKHARAILTQSRTLLRGAHTTRGGVTWSFEWLGSPRPVQVERNVRVGETDTNIAWVDDEYIVRGQENA